MVALRSCDAVGEGQMRYALALLALGMVLLASSPARAPVRYAVDDPFCGSRPYGPWPEGRRAYCENLAGPYVYCGKPPYPADRRSYCEYQEAERKYYAARYDVERERKRVFWWVKFTGAVFGLTLLIAIIYGSRRSIGRGLLNALVWVLVKVERLRRRVAGAATYLRQRVAEKVETD